MTAAASGRRAGGRAGGRAAAVCARACEAEKSGRSGNLLHDTGPIAQLITKARSFRSAARPRRLVQECDARDGQSCLLRWAAAAAAGLDLPRRSEAARGSLIMDCPRVGSSPAAAAAAAAAAARPPPSAHISNDQWPHVGSVTLPAPNGPA